MASHRSNNATRTKSLAWHGQADLLLPEAVRDVVQGDDQKCLIYIIENREDEHRKSNEEER